MLEALEQIKKELGSDALIVSARQVPGGPSWQVWKKTMVEVVAVRVEKDGNPEVEQVSTAKPSETKTKKKNEPAAPKAKNKSTTPKVSPAKLPEVPAIVQIPEKQDDELIEDTSPVIVRVQKAVLPELKIEKPVLQKINTDVEKSRSEKTSGTPVALMEKLGMIGLDAEAKPEIEMMFAETYKPEPIQSELNQSEPIRFEPAKVESPQPTISIEKFSELIKPQIQTQPENMWPLLAKIYQQLKDQGIQEEILNKVTEVSLEMISSKGMTDERRIRESLTRQLEAFVHIQKETSTSAQQVICLVGASGAGKTSLCAKLAVRYHNSMKKRVAWVSTDTVRTGAIAEARTYADAIGIPLHTAYTPEELYEAVTKEKISDVVLVDMTAVNPRSESSVVELGSFLTVIQRRSTWIVAPATAKASDLLNLAATLSPFKPKAIALTKLDETNTFGNAFNLAWRTQLPLVYYTFGPRVLDELSSARADTLVRAMFTERFDG